jgi:GNAT superfamily N-acetyltransferase
MTSILGVRFRKASSADVPAMVRCRGTDPTDNGKADPRMAAYLDGQHNPQEALPARVGYIALYDDTIIGYVAGHQTKRNGCSGELQYLFVAPTYRRRGIGTALLRLLAEWFHEQGAQRLCVREIRVIRGHGLHRFHGCVSTCGRQR